MPGLATECETNLVLMNVQEALLLQLGPHEAVPSTPNGAQHRDERNGALRKLPTVSSLCELESAVVKGPDVVMTRPVPPRDYKSRCTLPVTFGSVS